MNLYGFVFNSPTGYVDLLGLETIQDVARSLGHGATKTMMSYRLADGAACSGWASCKKAGLTNDSAGTPDTYKAYIAKKAMEDPGCPSNLEKNSAEDLVKKFLDAIDHKDPNIAKSIISTYDWILYRGTEEEDESCGDEKCYIELRLKWDLSNKTDKSNFFWNTLVRDGKGDNWKQGPIHVSEPKNGIVNSSACVDL
jgi:hypothetical protein